jgi:flagellar motor switch/type III secretory pathway protein FliN
VRLRAASHQTPWVPIEGGIAVEIVQLDEDGLDVTLEVETPLAIALAARALKRPPPKIPGLVGDAEAASLGGSLAAIVAAVSRSSGDSPLQVRAAGSSAAWLAKRRTLGQAVDTATFSIAVDGETFGARLLFHATPTRTTVQRFSSEQLRRLGTMPLEIPIVAATALSTVADVAALDIGDAWMLGAAPWARTLRGDVVLAAPGGERGARATLVEGGRLVLRAGSQELGGDPMPEDGANDPITLSVGDVPVVVRIEVGAARMTAREWASLAVGDIVGLARDIADPVTLRVGGVEVAKGELVDIEGEMGVRILALQAAERAP